MLKEIAESLQDGQNVSLSITKTSTGISVVLIPIGKQIGDKCTPPLLLSGDPDEIEAGLADQVLRHRSAEQAMISTIDASEKAMEAAKQEAAKKATTKKAVAPDKKALPAPTPDVDSDPGCCADEGGDNTQMGTDVDLTDIFA
jgi:PRTRC genetic system protein E